MVDSAKKSPRHERGLWQWLWRSGELAEARQSEHAVPAEKRAVLQRASAALELAERCVEPTDPLRSGSSLPLSLSLYREATYWALAAQHDQPAPSLAEAFAGTAPEVLELAADGAQELEQVKTALVTRGFRETAELTPERQRADAKLAGGFVKGLISLQSGPQRRVHRALVQRFVRSGTALALLLGLCSAAALLYTSVTRSPNLAAGKPWRVSSQHPGMPAATRGQYLFHTLEEDNPWFEVDLKAPTQFSEVEVVNRTDCCPERALPAVIEVSSDRRTWKEVSRRNETFSTWEAHFAPVKARYVRVRVLRRSILHLAALAVRVK